MDEASDERINVAADGCDRLSALPDAPLHCVMGFLTARQAVQTSALSRRWRDLWCSMPCVDIDHGTACSCDASASASDPYLVYCEALWSKLENFTTNLLMYHRAPVLDRFRLRVGRSPSVQDVYRWIRRGISYRPVELGITVASSSRLQLPSLGSARRLKTLRLCGFRLDGSFADNLRSGFPVLEDLEIKDCDSDFQEIVSTTLKRLAIESSYDNAFGDDGRPLSVTAPALASLQLAFPRCTNPNVFLVNGAESLLQASISGCHEFVDTDIFSLLGRLCNVRTLELCSFRYPDNARLLKKHKKMFPKLNNLETLVMACCDMSKRFDILHLFLQNAPSLKKVTLQHCLYPEILRRKGARRTIPSKYRKLISLESQDLNLIEIKYKDGDTNNLFRLLLSIRTRLQKNTVVLIKTSAESGSG